MQKILIDLSSIRINPDYVPAGCRRYVPGRPKISFAGKGEMPSQFIPRNTELTTLFSDLERYEGIITDIDSIDILALEKEIKDKQIQITVSIERDILETSTRFEDSTHFAEYVPTIVRCINCGKEFLHTELLTDSFEDFEEDVYDCSSEICPHCKTWDCCEIEYEDIEDALRRQRMEACPTTEQLKQQAERQLQLQKQIIEALFHLEEGTLDGTNNTTKEERGQDGC